MTSFIPENPVPIEARPTVFCLHALGSSAREFEGIAARLADDVDVVGLDLPGFGDLSAADGVTVDEMVAYVVRRIRSHGATRWMILGHSMGGKIASIVASRVLSGDAPLFGLAGVVLLAGSPPVPEPMDEERRERMLAWTDQGGLDDDAAREFVDANTGAPLPDDKLRAALTDLRRTSREAWRAWLQHGSREDWSEQVGTLDVPVLIVSGGADGDLGPENQQRLNGAVYTRPRFLTLDGAGHLLPLERTDEVSEAIRAFWFGEAGRSPVIPTDWSRLVASPRVQPRTRGILARRALADNPRYKPRVLSARHIITLRAVAARVVPQEGVPIDLATRIDGELADGKGDGWRSKELPSDIEAYRIALDALDGLENLADAEQDDALASLAADDGPGLGSMTQAAANAWFEDVRAALVRTWLAHSATMARIGFDGFANGSSGRDLSGYQLLAAGEREAWEPTLKESK